MKEKIREVCAFVKEKYNDFKYYVFECEKKDVRREYLTRNFRIPIIILIYLVIYVFIAYYGVAISTDKVTDANGLDNELVKGLFFCGAYLIISAIATLVLNCMSSIIKLIGNIVSFFVEDEKEQLIHKTLILMELAALVLDGIMLLV